MTNERMLIVGGRRLEGTVRISGAKNSAVAVIPATILSRTPCVIENLPDICRRHAEMREECVDVIFRFEHPRFVILGIHLHEHEKRSCILGTQKIEAPAKACDAVFVLRASVVFEVVVKHAVALPADFHHARLVLTAHGTMPKEQAPCGFRDVDAALVRPRETGVDGGEETAERRRAALDGMDGAFAHGTFC